MELKKCAFSGHRPKYFPWKYDETHPHCVWLKERLRKEVIRAGKDGYTYFIAGGAQGVDMWCAELVLDYKNKHQKEGIFLEIAAPFLNYEEFFPDQAKIRLYDILARADRQVVVSQQEDKNASVSKYYERNQYMINSAQRLIAVYDQSSGAGGGTKHTYEYAKKRNREIILIKWLSDYRQADFTNSTKNDGVFYL
jgi:uncharacterized phage-like protein YoqJ